MMILTAIVVAASGNVQTSENQAGLQALIQQVPAWLMVPLLVVWARSWRNMSSATC
jgi:hypothetical protein